MSLEESTMNSERYKDYPYSRPLPFCRDISQYKLVEVIGGGTYGVVYKARDKATNRIVAVKKILTENEKNGFPITALREARILKKVKFKHIVDLIEICCSKGRQNSLRNFFFVFEFCDHDLAGLLSSNIKLELCHKKSIMKQLLSALYIIHHFNILHRDMKPANILITRDGVLKLADFGLSQFYNENSRNQCLTNRVVTLWYRPPELLLGSKHYGPKIDMWGTGCIMAELWLKCALFQGNTEIQQLSVISNLCGSITPETLPEVKELPLYNKIRLVTGKKRQLKENLRFHIRDALALDLIDKLLQLDSQKRLNTEGAISHSFFSTAPNDGGLRELLSNIHVNMFDKDSQKRRAQEQLQRDPKRRCADLCESIVY